MPHTTFATRMRRATGLMALALALTAPASFAAGEPGTGGTGGGGVTTPKPGPTAAPCATVESFTIKGSKGPGLTAEVGTGFNIVSCSTNPETVVYDMVLTGSFTKETYWTVTDWPAGLLGAGKSLAQKWTMGGVPYHTGTRLDITVKDAATGAVLDTQTGFAAAVSGKP